MENAVREPTAKQLVVFHLLPRVPYALRIIMAFALILAGFAVQCTMLRWFPGVIFVFAGNLFLLVKGYDNHLKYDKFDASANWQPVEPSRLGEIEELNKKSFTWDRSFLDISNRRGWWIFFLIAVSTIAGLLGWFGESPLVPFVGWNIIALFLPHWITGTRKILTLPDLLVKVYLIKKLLADSAIQQKIEGLKIDYYMLLRGDKEKKLPDDIKFRVVIANQHPDFLGFYGQIVNNTVNGNAYPYFYVVMVAKAGYGLKTAVKDYAPSRGIIGEYDDDKGVEVFVIRQATSRTSGYLTKPDTVRLIFSEGFDLARNVAVRG
jgi:hypothetical protein